jgi:hypothetical protein
LLSINILEIAKLKNVKRNYEDLEKYLGGKWWKIQRSHLSKLKKRMKG